ncbi:MAG: gas vesicle protein K [Thaumarchaeota archaeon]|nr:gas vesicle protein K [Nitrososphaerota archaeon]
MLRTRQARDASAVLEELRLGGRKGNDDVKTGLARLVLTVVEIVRQVLEKQAVRRVDAGDLTPEEVERLGAAFVDIKAALFDISNDFGVKPEELTAQLGAIVSTGDSRFDRASVAELLDKLLDRGAVVAGSIKLSVADIDLITLDLLAMLYPVYKTGRGTARR